MTAILKCLEHQADLSIYAQGRTILYVCASGHWWQVRASDTGSTTKSAADRAHTGVALDPAVGGDRSLLHLQEQFGAEVLEALTFE